MKTILIDHDAAAGALLETLARLPLPVPVVSIHEWHNGAYRHATDIEWLRVAAAEDVTVLSCDVNTIPAACRSPQDEPAGQPAVILCSQFAAHHQPARVAAASRRLIEREAGQLQQTVYFLRLG